jgi:isopenicillin N synthase-like dioxygenase
MTIQPSLPIIDMAGVSRRDPQAMAKVARQIEKACTETGFFYTLNHGLASDIVSKAVGAAEAFFALPAEIKRRNDAVNHRGYIGMGDAFMKGATRSDFKESYVIGLELTADDPDVVAGEALRGPNVWPREVPAFQRYLSAYFEAIAVCGADLLSVFALSLGQNPDFFVDKYTKRLQRTNVIHYPPHPVESPDDQFGGAAHTDYGCVTLLWQDQNGGLEVQKRDGAWVAAQPIPDTLVINVGDLLERWSGGRYVSNMHRVVNRSGRERYSIATFFDPNYRAVVDPASFGLEGDAANDAPILAGDYILGRVRGSFSYRSV